MSEEHQNLMKYCEIIRGFPCPILKVFKRKNFEDAMDFMPGDGDLIITSYPKTGTTLMQYIVLQIKSKGQLFPSFDDATYKVVPYIEMVGVAPVNAQSKPRLYKRHLPYDMVHKNSKSKCIYIYRHPEDTLVSFYHFTRNIFNYTMNFDEFFERFVNGNIYYGSYFQHVLSFYKHREDENLLMVSYEKLQASKKQEILRIAKFLGEEYYNGLLEDDQLIDNIIERTSFDNMKKNLYVTHPYVISGLRGISPNSEQNRIPFFRKGIVGDGKAVLTECQRQRLKAAAENVLKDTFIINEWYPN